MAEQETCSWLTTQTTRGSHCYTVKGYSLLEGGKPGKCIKSDVFTVSGYNWAIKLYPDGDRQEHNSYLSVYTILMSKDAEVMASYDLILLDQSGNNDHFIRSCSAITRFDSAATHGWGFQTFYKRSSLKTSKYMKQDSFVLRCIINVVTTTKEPPIEYSLQIPQPNLGHCLRGFLNSGMASDIVIKIGNKEMKAHKVILAARSPVFQAHFFGPLGNPKTEEIVVENIPPLIFQAMLDFMYSDSIPDFHELKLSSYKLTACLQHLLAAADRYGIERLKLLCASKLCEELTADTVASTLAVAELHNCCGLKSACMKFVLSQKNLEVVLKSDGFGELEKSPLSDLLEIIADDCTLKLDILNDK